MKKKDKQERSILQEENIASPMRTALTNFFSKKLAIIGLVMFTFVFFSCMFLPFIFPLDKNFQDPTQQNISPGFTFLNVPASLSKNAKAIDGGASYGVGLDKNGGLYMWGKLDSRLKSRPTDMGPLKDISAGYDHVLALGEDGRLHTWGNNRMNLANIPHEIEDANIVKIEAGYQISTALDDQGNLYVWGNQNIIDISPKRVQGEIKDYAINTSTAIALLNDGTVTVLMNKETPLANIPESIQGHITTIASAEKVAAAILDDGSVVTWGARDDYLHDIPDDIQGHAVDIKAGRLHFTVLLDDGTVKTWGHSNMKQTKVPAVTGATAITADYYQSYAIDSGGKVYAWGLKGYLMGSDQYGRDVFRRLLEGGRISLTIGVISVAISGSLGIIIGCIAGFYGKKVDIILMRASEVVSAIPFMPLAIILSAIIGSRISENARVAMIMVIIGLLGWPGLARLTRAQILAERENEFVTAAKAMGIREHKIIFRHILPNVLTVVLVNLTLSLALSMLLESTLSFIGFGVLEPSPTWGNMLTSCINSTVLSQYWWRWAFPSLALGMATISINIVGDALHDAIDPKSNDR